MNKQKECEALADVDILGSVEFDLSEGIKDLIWNIKLIKNDVDVIKEHLNL